MSDKSVDILEEFGRVFVTNVRDFAIDQAISRVGIGANLRAEDIVEVVDITIDALLLLLEDYHTFGLSFASSGRSVVLNQHFSLTGEPHGRRGWNAKYSSHSSG